MIDPSVITGIGVVSPIGIGKKVFWNALIRKTSGIKEITKFDTTPYLCRRAAEITGFPFEDFITGQRFRRAADISRYAIGAVTLAIEDAGLKELNNRTSLIMGITHGAMNMSREFHRGLVSGDGASPMLFSDSVLNAPAGNVSVCFGIKGASHTLVGGGPIGIRAIGFASDLLTTKRADIVIVGGAEEFDEVVHHSYSRFGYLCKGNELSPFDINRNGFVMGEGAGVLVLERKKDALKRGARIYAEVSGWDVGFSLNRSDEAMAKIMGKTLDKGGVEPDLIGYISSGANGSSLDYLETGAIKKLFKKAPAPFIGSIKPDIGEAFSATTILQAVSASLVMESRMIPPNINLSTTHPEWHGLSIPIEVVKAPPIKAVMVNSIGIEGTCASLVMKRLEV
ncbi:MAG: beta-ketoacyl-[acyl-carrier-protein] synthase family protein [Thermodesulfobacteriota bacterium]